MLEEVAHKQEEEEDSGQAESEGECKQVLGVLEGLLA
jgi:hypothetical protein